MPARIDPVLTSEVEQLTQKVTSVSRSSSRPPSSDVCNHSKHPPSTSKPQHVEYRAGTRHDHTEKIYQELGHIDRQVIVPPETYQSCSGSTFTNPPRRVRIHTVSELAAPTIEVMSYEQHYFECETCSLEVWGTIPSVVIETQNLGTRFQAFLVWLDNCSNLPYEKQQELLLEICQIHMGKRTCKGPMTDYRRLLDRL